MLDMLRSRWRLLALWTGALIALFAAGGLLFIWSGVYNVAASKQHFDITRWLLETTMRRSIAVRGLAIDVPPLDDADLVRLGAGHFQGGCAPCHGAPGEPRNPIVRNMLPTPPPLEKAAPEWSSAELFWIVKHGLKYTGMPAWSGRPRDDDVWAVVAFLQGLPDLDAEEYRRLAFGNAAPPDRAAGEVVDRGTPGAATTTCARCHGDAQNSPTSRLVPNLAGQSPAYLERALREYADGRRASGIMQPVAALLAEQEIRDLAAFYGELARRSEKVTRSSGAEETDRGRGIARRGVPERGIPPCLACHSGRASASFPLLAGQSASYLAQQLALWRRGLRDDTTHGAIMSVIAGRLTGEDIAAVTRYFENATTEDIARDTDGVAPR